MSKQNSTFEPKLCVICGKEYIPINGSQLCCSKECAKRRENERKAAQYKGKFHYGKNNGNGFDSMSQIRALVADGPDYGMKVARMEGRIWDKHTLRVTQRTKETLEEVLDELRIE